MLTSFEVKNFRCFDELRLSSLRRINVFAGRNNVGKTSLLEALFLLLGGNNPSLTMNLNMFRRRTGLRTELGAMWGHLFRGMDTAKPISLAAESEAGRTALTIAIERPEQVELTADNVAAGGRFPVGIEYQLEHKGLVKGAKIRARVEMVGAESAKLVLSPPPVRPLFWGIFLHATGADPAEDADRFSELSKGNKKDALAAVIAALRELEPRLHQLSVLTDGRFKEIYGELKDLAEKVPLSVMGEGMVRLASMLLAIFASRQGIVLIDEFENGLHYTVLPGVWQAVGKAAKDANAQVFATTHSYECLQAAKPLLEESSDAVKFLRLQRVGERIKAVDYEREVFDVALSEGIEVR
jgi:predicted ATP-dependent endonuclease of OLD family